MADPGPLRIELPDAAATREFGRRLGAVLRAGDLVVATGDLGAGKTTLVQGIADGLQVRGPVTSPTFVIARIHPSLVGGPALLHVDAYRLEGRLDVDDLDLDTDLAAAVTVVEWGAGRVEQLSANRLELTMSALADEQRVVAIATVGPRWRDDAAQAELARATTGLP